MRCRSPPYFRPPLYHLPPRPDLLTYISPSQTLLALPFQTCFHPATLLCEPHLQRASPRVSPSSFHATPPTCPAAPSRLAISSLHRASFPYSCPKAAKVWLAITLWRPQARNSSTGPCASGQRTQCAGTQACQLLAAGRDDMRSTVVFWPPPVLHNKLQ